MHAKLSFTWGLAIANIPLTNLAVSLAGSVIETRFIVGSLVHRFLSTSPVPQIDRSEKLCP